MGLIAYIRRKLKLPSPAKSRLDGNFHKSEKIIVFIFAYMIALGMWMLINLDREFSLTIDLPLIYGEFPENQAPTEPLPEYARASITGEGWKLLNLYGTTPRIAVNLEDESVNIVQAVQNQLVAQGGLNVTQVTPSFISIRLEERVTRKVAVEPRVDIQFRRQFNVLGSPDVFPDSITITGARSLVERFDAWPTRRQSFDDLHQPLDIQLELEPVSDLIRMSETRVNYRLNVSEFTEGEVRIPVMIRGDSESLNYSLSPGTIRIRYDIPIGQYSQAQDKILFDAFVNFSDLQQDTTGFIEPEVIPVTREFDLNIRAVQPRRLSYFRIVRN